MVTLGCQVWVVIRMSCGNINFDLSLLGLARSRTFPFWEKGMEPKLLLEFSISNISTLSLPFSPQGWVEFSSSECSQHQMIFLSQYLPHCAYLMDTCATSYPVSGLYQGQGLAHCHFCVTNGCWNTWKTVTSLYLFNWTHKIISMIINIKCSYFLPCTTLSF